jgi:hypothetical protein
LKGLIVGCGSAGSRYLRSALDLNHKVTVFDSDNRKVKTLAKEYSDIKIAIDLEFVHTIFDYAVISTNSDSHLQIFNILSSYSNPPEIVIVEKLITNSFSNIDSFRNVLQRQTKINLRTHNRWKLLGAVGALQRLAFDFNLGTFLHFSSIGGGMCLASGSIHWIASFYDMFAINLEDFEIRGDISLFKQESRPQYSTALGNLELKFPNTSLDFKSLPTSHVAPIQIFLFEHGVITLHFTGEYQVAKGDPEGFLSKPFRYTTLKIMESGVLFSPNLDPFTNLLREIESSDPVLSDFVNALNANEIILLSQLLPKESPINSSSFKKLRQEAKTYNRSWTIT